MWTRWIGAMVVPLAVFQGCGDATTNLAAKGCTKDTDCKGARICVSGTSVSGSLYNDLSSCASTSCASAPCPNINL